MKRWLVIFFASLVITVSGAQEFLTIVTPGILPFSWEADGKVTGIGTDLTTEIFKRLAIPIEIKIFPPARALSMVQSGEGDCIFLVAKTPDRATFLNYPSEPIIDQPVSLYAMSDSPVNFDGDIKKLARFRIGMIMGSRYSSEFEEMIKNKEFATLSEVTEYSQLVKLLELSRVDIIIGPRSSIFFAAKQIGLKDKIKELTPPIVASSPAYLAVSKKGKAAGLVDKINVIILEMKKDGTYDRIVKSYLK